MRNTFQFIDAHKRFIVLILTISLSLGMMFMGESGKTHFARTVTTAIFTTGRFSFSWGIYLLDLWRENRRLRLQNLDLSDQIYFHDYVVRENQRLRRLLEFKQRQSLAGRAIPAMVIGHDIDRIVNTLILDVGSRDGVRKNMAVVTAEGLVGRIYTVYSSSSSVQIIRDVNSRVSAVAGDIYGIVRWDGGPYLRMYGLPLNNIPEPGETVYTTGIGGVFPPGLFIGTIVDSRPEDVEQYASVNVETEVDFSTVHEVFIIRGSERADVWNDAGGGGRFQRPEIQ